jgi:hypothetical protein
MSNEIDSQITESVFKDEFLKFYHKKKYYLFALFFLLIFLPIFYQIFLSINKKNHSAQLEKYSELILSSKVQESDIKNLLKSNNETVALLSLNKLIETNKKSNDIILFFDEVINNGIISVRTKELLKIKKSIFIFDNATEEEMLFLLNLKNKKSFFKKINLEIMYDFYLSKNQKIKAEELKRIINEN